MALYVILKYLGSNGVSIQKDGWRVLGACTTKRGVILYNLQCFMGDLQMRREQCWPITEDGWSVLVSCTANRGVILYN